MSTEFDPLALALRAIAEAAAPARDPWWIIGSAALLLHGVDPGQVGDVDVLMSDRDAAVLLSAKGVEPAPGVPSDRFRSAVFGRWTAAGVAVETMGGFEVRDANGWTPVWPATRVPVIRCDTRLFVPDRPDLAALLRRFGRPKDLARAALLDHAGPIPKSAGPNACGSSAESG